MDPILHFKDLMKQGMLFVLIYMFGFGASAQVSKDRLLDFISSGLSPQEQTDLMRTQYEVERLMPQTMKERMILKKPKKGYTLLLEDYKEHVAGSSNRKGELKINRKLLKEPALFKKTLIHEWAHIYDFINWHPQPEASQISWCDTWRNERNHKDNHMGGECDLYWDVKTSVSTTAEFQEIAGWFLSLNGQGNRIRKSYFTLRSPDIYESKSQAEMFAVNMEYFLTDPEYQCRRPTMYRYLRNHFNHVPFAEMDCREFQKIVDPSFSSAAKALVPIDKSRLYQVHYLLASRGSGISAKFGHSMFRLVMCAPHRTVMGPDCLKDIRYHIILSFRAFVNTPDISNMAGLTGDYPSRLFFIPFPQVIEEYNKTELRDLQSYPLFLSREEINQFVDRSIETHWAYDGLYYFLSNNCATESINLLRSATLRKELMNESSQTPYGLRNELVRAKLTRESYFYDRKWALENGYLFASHEEHLEKALEIISDTISGSEAGSLSRWLEQTPTQRRAIFQSHLPKNKADQKKYAAAFLLLESQAERDSESSLQSFIYKLLKSSDVEAGIAETIKSILAIQSGFFESKGQLTTPAQMLKIGYGLPSASENRTMQRDLETIARRRVESKNMLADLYQRIFEPSQFEQVNQIRQNKDVYTKVILAR